MSPPERWRPCQSKWW